MDAPRFEGSPDLPALARAARKLSATTGTILLVDSKPDGHTGGAVVVRVRDRSRHVSVFTLADLEALV